MSEQKQSLETLQDIMRIMERSSKFISLSGLSGVAAGICALIGAWLVNLKIQKVLKDIPARYVKTEWPFLIDLLIIGAGTFLAAFLSALIFTILKSKKYKLSLWGNTTARMLWNLLIPLLIGGIFLFKLILLHQYRLIAPGCLLFYGLALVNASKYTLGEIRFLGYGQLILGVINLWVSAYDLYFWAAGFGILHIIYGIIMWWKYERKN